MKKLFLAILPFTAVLLLSACSAQPSAQAASATGTPSPDEVQGSGGLIAEGRLFPVNTLDQSFGVPGQVAEVLVQDGQTVSAGQVLARLAAAPELQLALARAEEELLSAQQALDALATDSDDQLAQARLDYLAAEDALEEAQDDVDGDDSDENLARLDQAKASLKAAEDTFLVLEAGNGVDPDQLAAARARITAARAGVASAQAALDHLELRSTLSGVVVDLDLQPGQRVTAGQPVLTVADFSSWIIRTDNLTETDVVAVQVGQPVQATLDALPNTPLQGKVTHINARYEEKRGDITYTVTIELIETDPLMRWGMTAAVEFEP